MRDYPGFDIGPATVGLAVLIWIAVFVVHFAQQKDYTGDGEFTVSDVSGVARQASVGWVEDYAKTLPCEPQSASDRFWETSPCESVGSIKWLVALAVYGFSGFALACAVALYHRVVWLFERK